MFERPSNCLIYTEYTVTRALHSFYTFNYFTLDLSGRGACLHVSGLRLTALLRPSAPMMPTLSSSGHWLTKALGRST
jgi:hypothetical protein